MKFILTKELGRLTKWLRILGFDAAYVSQGKDSSLIIQSLREDRVILTRNQSLGTQKGIRIAYIQSERIKEQIHEVLKKFAIQPDQNLMFNRCILCNEKLVEIGKTLIKDKVPEYVYATQENFITCPKCNRIYWQGTHWGNVKKILEEIQ